MMEIGGHYDEIYTLSEFMKVSDFNLKSGGNVMQIFMGDRSHTTLTKKFKPERKEAKEIREFLNNKKTKTKLFIHGNLRVNLSAPLKPRYLWNQNNVIFDMVNGHKIGASGVVVHLGTKTLQGHLQSEKDAYANMNKSIKYILDNSSKSGIKLLLEVNAGQENKVGKTVSELARIYHRLPEEYQKRIGFCLDTVHLFSAGFHMDTVNGVKAYFDEFNKKIGIKKIMVTHLNDSATEFGSGVDRHYNLGEGYIYTNNLAPLATISQILKKNKIPIVLETREPSQYKKEIKLIKKLANTNPKMLCQKGGSSDSAQVFPIFRKMEMLHLILGNQFQAKAYKNAIAMIKAYLLKQDETHLTADDLESLATVEGIGKETIAKIMEIMQTGGLKRMQELLKAVPYNEKQIDAMVELQKVMGIGPKVAQKMVDQGIMSVEDLKKRSRSGDIKLTQMQQIGMKYYQDLQKPIQRKEVEKWKEVLLKKIATTVKASENLRGVLAGSYRLGKKQSGDIDLIVMVNDIKTLDDLEKKGGDLMLKFIEALKKTGILVDYLPLGETEFLGMVRMPTNTKKDKIVRHLDLKLIPTESLPFYLLYFGSGEKFSRKIRAIAKKQGYKLSQWGLENLKTKKFVPIKDEKDIFKKLGVPYVSPEDRLF